MRDPLEQAIVAAAEHGAPPKTFHVGRNATFRLAEGTGHLLADATITHWTQDD